MGLFPFLGRQSKALLGAGRRGTLRRPCPPPTHGHKAVHGLLPQGERIRDRGCVSLLLYLPAQSATPSRAGHHHWRARGLQSLHTNVYFMRLSTRLARMGYWVITRQPCWMSRVTGWMVPVGKGGARLSGRGTRTETSTPLAAANKNMPPDFGI